jgi:FMN phosphatase YigB (HAD superfamily)
MGLPTWLMDFDQTLANTFEPAPGALGVEVIYEVAIAQLWGQRELAAYQAAGRSPDQVVAELYPEASDAELVRLTEALIEARLELALVQIGTPLLGGGVWPRPCAGFIPFWERALEYLERGRLDAGIISSGHTRFIERTFQVWGLKPPPVIVSIDDMRRFTRLGVDRRSKPSPACFALARQRLMRLHGQSFDIRTASVKSGIVYVGDDPEKDGQLARRAGVRFGWFDPAASALEYGADGFRFPDWGFVAGLLPD